MKRRIALIVLSIVTVVTLVLPPSAVAAPPSVAPGGIIYVVRRGDTLWRISRQYGVTINAIMVANGLSNPNRILVGQRLLIPTSISLACNFRIHYVQRGETLSSLSRRYGVSVWSIVQANRLLNPNLIFVGQRLIIPRAGITIETPAPNTIITGNTVHVSGRGSAFENTLVVEVRTAAGTLLGRAPAMITGVEMGQVGPYALDLTFTQPTNTVPGRIIVYESSARDGSIIDQACVDVTLQGSTPS